MPTHLPNQRVSQKVKESKEFYKPTCDYYIKLGTSLNNRTETKHNFDAANGIINPNKFKDVISPFTKDINEVLPKLPGEIRDVDFITPIKEKNLGEYIELPYRFFVKAENADMAMKLDMDVREEVYNLLVEGFEKLLASNGQEQPQVDFKEYYTKRIKELLDQKAIDATNILNLINEETDFDSLRYQLFYDWWSTEEFYTYRELVNDKIVKHRISPLVAYPISNGSQFVKDYDAFVWRNTITFDQLLESQQLRRDITDEELSKLDALTVKDGMVVYSTPEIVFGRIDTFRSAGVSTHGSDPVFARDNGTIFEWNVIWKSQSEEKELIYQDEYGNERRTIVPKDYKLNTEIGDISLKTIWIPKVYHMKRYGDENVGIYTKPKELEIQLYDEATNSLQLPVGGKRGLLLDVAINPIPKRIIPFMIVDKILLLIIEREIAKYLPYIKAIPQSLINPDSTGTTKQKFALMKADNTLIFDDTKVDLQTAVQGLRVIQNNGLAEYINTLWQIRMNNKQDAWDIANMNSERFGATSQQQTVTNASQNIYRAKLGSTLMITMFNKALEHDHKLDLEYSKYAYANGKKGVFFDKNEGEFVSVEIDPLEHLGSQYYPIVVNSKVEEDKLNQYKELAFSAAQNGDFDLASEAIAADNSAQLRQMIRQIVDAKKAYEASIATRNEELALQREQEITAREERKMAAEKELQDSINATDIEVKYIEADISKYKVDNTETATDTAIDTKDDPIAKSKLRLAERKAQLDAERLAHQKKVDDAKFKQAANNKK